MIDELDIAKRGGSFRACRRQEMDHGTACIRENDDVYDDDFDCESFLALDYYLRQPVGTPASAELVRQLREKQR